MTERKTLMKRLTAGVGAFALATVGFFAASTAAYAENGDDNGNGGATPVQVANIDTSEQGKLVIHKFDGNPGDEGDGTELDTDNMGNPLEGVKFTIWRVTYNGNPIDLTTYQGWVDAQGATPANVEAGADDYDKIEVTTVTTGTDGVATFTPAAGGAGFGLYFVKETAPGSNLIVSPVVSFLVAIPYPSDGDWLYTVHVYPKNKVDTDVPDKKVTDPGHDLVKGDEVVWTITKKLPAVSAGFKKLVITDTLDSRLDYVEVDIENYASPADYGVSQAGQTVTIEFTEAGLAKLEAGETVTVTLTTKVNALGDDASFKNKALVNVNDAEQETNEVKTFWGSLELLKVDKENNKALSGAKFKLYDGKDGLLLQDGYETGSNGRLTINGLWVGNDPAETREYCLLETEAPAGYITPVGDIAWTCFDVSADGMTAVTKTAKNTKQEGPKLPQTGSSATVIMMLVGLGLVGTAGALFAARRTRTSH